MSVVKRPTRRLALLAFLLCLVSTVVLLAEQDNTLFSDDVMLSVNEALADVPGVSAALNEQASGRGEQPAEPVEAAAEDEIKAAEPVEAAAAAEDEIKVAEPVEVAAENEIKTAEPVEAVAEDEIKAAEPVEAVAKDEIKVAKPAAAAVEAAIKAAEPAETAIKAAEPVEVAAENEIKTAEPVEAAAEAAAKAVEPVEVAAESEIKAAESVEVATAAEDAKAPANAEEAKESSGGFFEVLGRVFDTSRINVLIIIVLLIAFVSYFTFHAQRGKKLFIRRISGLSAIEDAVGRATEMGRGVLYIPGIMDMDDIQTIAGVTIMGHVAKKAAEYDTPFYAPMTRSFVMSVAQEVVKQAYLEKGRPDAFRADRINYLTDDQFGYVAGASGIMMREKPAACFFLGTFYAECLILAETGSAVGAIQIAGTAEPSQIPFFVAACDYTLIGEELFAASAYLSKSPKEIGSLKGQDFIKLVFIFIILLGTLLVTVANTSRAQDTVFTTLADNFMRMLK